jgi:hypothetical protein
MLWWDIFDATGKLEVESEVKRRLVVFYTYMAIKKGTCLFVLHFNLLKFINLFRLTSLYTAFIYRAYP